MYMSVYVRANVTWCTIQSKMQSDVSYRCNYVIVNSLSLAFIAKKLWL